MRDVPLDEFTGEDESEKDEAGEDRLEQDEAGEDEPEESGPDADETGDTEQGEASVDSEPPTVTPTSDWTPTGGRCSACGDHIRRRWSSNERMLCSSCKQWDVE